VLGFWLLHFTTLTQLTTPLHFLRCQLNATASFHQDLGLDSLDAVEVVMAVEEVRVSSLPTLEIIFISILQEFSIEIPDAEADEIQTVAQGTVLYTPHGITH